MTPVDASVLAAGGTTAQPVLVGEFQGYGISQFVSPNNWNSLHTPDATLLAVDGAGDVFAALSSGVFQYPPSIPPGSIAHQLTTAAASLLAVKPDGDVFADLQGMGIVLFPMGGGQQTASTAHASVLAAEV